MRKLDPQQTALDQQGDFLQENDIDKQRRERLQNLLQENSLPSSTPLMTAAPPGVRRPGR